MRRGVGAALVAFASFAASADGPAPGRMVDPCASPLEEAIGTEALDLYEAALGGLQQEEREAIIARVELGQSYQEVAAILGKPSAEAARVAVYRALIRLAQQMHPVV